MFNLFKKNANNEVVVAEPKVELKGKTTNEIIDEIHESFFTEVDKLLSDAKISKSLDTDKQDLIDKCKRLKELGFTNTKEVKEAEAEINRLTKIKEENESKKTLIEAINYFSVKYPMYKFITEDSVKKICAKYNLIYSTVDRYTGTVPDKNLKQMEVFKVANEDKCYVEVRDSIRSWSSKTNISFEEYIENHPDYTSEDRKHWALQKMLLLELNYTNAPLEIAAPIKDFDTKGMELKDFKLSKIEIPDPVVLQPVFYARQKHYLIVTAWGQEASDELVVNQKMN